MAVGLVLAILFGSIGMLYATVKGAVTMLIVQIVTVIIGVIISVLTFGFGSVLLLFALVVENFLCAYYAYKAIEQNNAEATQQGSDAV